MMYDYIYNFIALRKADRLRMKRFKELPKIHKHALDQGLLLPEYSCYTQVFEYYREK